MSVLRLVNETEVTSTINTLNITGLFTDDFDIYVIEATDIAMTSSSGDYLFGRVITVVVVK